MLANARLMSERLLHLGWDTIVIDAQWFEPNARREAQREVLRELDCVVWSSVLDGDLVVAIFNIGDAPLSRVIRLDALGVDGRFLMFEWWTGQTIEVDASIPAALAPHDAMLVRLTALG